LRCRTRGRFGGRWWAADHSFGLSLSKPGRAGSKSMLVLRAEAGTRPGGRGTCSLLRQRKVPKRKATPSLRPLRCAKGQTCVGAAAGCAVELALLLRSAARTTTASQFTRHARFDAHAHPATAPPQAQPAGGWTAEHPTAEQPHGPSRCSASRSRRKALAFVLTATDQRQLAQLRKATTTWRNPLPGHLQ
jgi:hypothetical protein